MRRALTFLLLTILAMCGVSTTGCASRLAASIQAVAEPDIPQGLTWAAIPGVGLSTADPAVSLAVDQAAAVLAPALSVYNWKWLSNPAEAENADVLVRISWGSSKPQYTQSLMPTARPGIGFGLGLGHGPWHRHPFYNGFGGYYAEPVVEIIYTHSLALEAIQAAALTPEVKSALLYNVSLNQPGTQPTPNLTTSAQPNISKPPYAPAIRMDESAPLSISKTDAQLQQGPYAPPILNSDTDRIPAQARLWRVEVSSGGTRANIHNLLPRLTAAAAQAVGKTMQANVFVDGDMHVTYNLP